MLLWGGHTTVMVKSYSGVNWGWVNGNNYNNNNNIRKTKIIRESTIEAHPNTLIFPFSSSGGQADILCSPLQRKQTCWKWRGITAQGWLSFQAKQAVTLRLFITIGTNPEGLTWDSEWHTPQMTTGTLWRVPGQVSQTLHSSSHSICCQKHKSYAHHCKYMLTD